MSRRTVLRPQPLDGRLIDPYRSKANKRLMAAVAIDDRPNYAIAAAVGG